MSVWSDSVPSPASLSGAEGELVAVRFSVEPRLLEEVLEALAEIPFPINPQIYHQAGCAYVYPDGHQEVQPATMVEFPAYLGQLEAVRKVLEKHGLPLESLHFQSMLDDLHSDRDVQPAPEGAPYRQVILYKQMSRS